MKPYPKIFFLILIFCLLLTGCGSAGQEGTPTPENGSAKDFSPVISATGIVVPEKWAALSMRSQAVVAEVLVSEGEKVVAGQLLVRLDRELAHGLRRVAAVHLPDTVHHQLRIPARDVRPRISARELKESESKYRILFENEIYGIVIFDPETGAILDGWLEENFQAIQALALQVRPTALPPAIQQRLDNLRSADRDFRRIAIINRDAVAVAYSPRLDALAADSGLLLRAAKEEAGLFYLMPGANAFGAALLTSAGGSLTDVIEAIEGGAVKALLLVESDPFWSFPDRERLKRATDRLDLLLVMDYLPSKSARSSSVQSSRLMQASLRRSSIRDRSTTSTRSRYGPRVTCEGNCGRRDGPPVCGASA